MICFILDPPGLETRSLEVTLGDGYLLFSVDESKSPQPPFVVLPPPVPDPRPPSCIRFRTHVLRETWTNRFAGLRSVVGTVKKVGREAVEGTVFRGRTTS